MESAEIYQNGGSIKYSFLQFLNFLTFLLGITLLIMDCVIWGKVKNFNSFILSLMIVSFFIIFVTLYGFMKIKYNPDSLLVYFVLISLLELGLIIFTIYIFNNKTALVEFLVKNMDDSYDAILEAMDFVARNLDAIKILMLTYCVILVRIL